MDIPAMLPSDTDDGQGVDQPDDPIMAALDSLKDQIDAIEAQIMAQKGKPDADAAPSGSAGSPITPPTPKVSV